MSVIVPAFTPRWLDEALDTVRRQTFRNLEIIVVDDGSPEPVTPEYSDDLVVVRQSNAGPGGARNQGVAVARGEFVAFLDSDDRWLPEKLAGQVEFLERNPTHVLSSTNWRYIGSLPAASGHVRFDRSSSPGPTISFDRLFAENCICCSAVMVRREALQRTPGMLPRRRFGEDYDLWLRLALIGPLGYLDDVLVEKRLHAGSLVQQAKTDGSWFTEELAVYAEFLRDHAELAEKPFVRSALGRLYFERGYQLVCQRQWRSARHALLRSLRYDPRRTATWRDLVRVLLHV